MDVYNFFDNAEERFSKDSKEVTEKDIAELASIIRSAEYRYFIFTHGTDAMARNAKLLQGALQDSGRVVVFVGAMIPLSMSAKHKSDAVDNLQFALEHIHELENGVNMVGYNPQTKRRDFYNPDKVEKNFVVSKENLQLIFTSR